MQFKCSLIGRRFPQLQALKHEQVADLVIANRKATSQKMDADHKTWPKSREDRVAILHFADGTTSGKWSTYLHGQLGHKEVQLVTYSKGEEGRWPVQRENPVWQWAGDVCPGRVHWRYSGKVSGRDAVCRHRLQVRSCPGFRHLCNALPEAWQSGRRVNPPCNRHAVSPHRYITDEAWALSKRKPGHFTC
jgi:hypothetical protein